MIALRSEVAAIHRDFRSQQSGPPKCCVSICYLKSMCGCQSLYYGGNGTIDHLRSKSPRPVHAGIDWWRHGQDDLWHTTCHFCLDSLHNLEQRCLVVLLFPWEVCLRIVRTEQDDNCVSIALQRPIEHAIAHVGYPLLRSGAKGTKVLNFPPLARIPRIEHLLQLCRIDSFIRQRITHASHNHGVFVLPLCACAGGIGPWDAATWMARRGCEGGSLPCHAWRPTIAICSH
mmetsp:Transcript_51216/g.115303  ORF Transcript_51216/g.115303 Transcript_51216/m.115303 type:complete len:230 (+) Transcript_51216:417-1106(+)